MAISEQKEKEFERLLTEHLKRQYNNGLRIGAITVSQVVLDLLNDTSKPLMNRIEAVKKYCRISDKLKEDIEKEKEQIKAQEQTQTQEQTETVEDTPEEGTE
jgi:gas vesicle protein